MPKRKVEPAILEALKMLGGVATPAEIIERSELHGATVRNTLRRMLKAGTVGQDVNGNYVLPAQSGADSANVTMSTRLKAGYGSFAEPAGSYETKQPGPEGLAVIAQHVDYELFDAEGNVRYRVWILVEAAEPRSARPPSKEAK